jgi:uncharacterized protein
MIAINVAQLLLAPQGTVRRYDLDEELAGVGAGEAPARVHGQVSLLRTGHGILADGTFSTTLAAECSRCLEETTTAVSGRFQEEFVPTVEVRTGAPLPADPQTEAFPIDANHVLDLSEAIRQHIVMATPIQPLCEANCRGLCPDCGHNLNEGPCACAPGLGDSPFAELRQLLEPPDDRARGA